MARIDFYVLSQSGEQARQLFACRLAEKAYKLEHTVHIHTGDEATAGRIDDLLWTFRDGSFVPHDRVRGGADEPRAPVTVGCDPGYAGRSRPAHQPRRRRSGLRGRFSTHRGACNLR